MYVMVRTTAVMVATNGIVAIDNVLGLVLSFAESLVIILQVFLLFFSLLKHVSVGLTSENLAMN